MPKCDDVNKSTFKNVKNFFTYFFIFVFLPAMALSQNAVLGPESFNWFFGENAGIRFISPESPPTAVRGSLVTEEGCATVSDSEGNLLFYCSGETIWNRNHNVMRNGANMRGGFSSTQAVLIIQVPGVNDLFYVFNTENLGGRLTYSIVDMSLEGGLGAVTQKSLLIADSIAEKLTSVYHENGADVWLVVKEKYSHAFRSYLITRNGISLTPVVSHLPLDFDLNHKYSSMGYLNFSPNGEKLASASYSASQFELYNFNRTTGEISNPIVLKIPDDYNAYGVCFSPDGSKLYTSYYDYDAFLVQYDLTKYDSAAIVNSKKVIAEFDDGLAVGAIQVAPNGKIYVSRYKSSYLSCINKPNESGSKCEFQPDAVFLNGNKTRLGLPNFTYVNKFISLKPDPKYHNIYIRIADMKGSPGDSTSKIKVYARTLNDSIKAKNINLSAKLMFDADCFWVYDNNLIISNKIVADKRVIDFELENLTISKDENLVCEFDGMILLAENKLNKLALDEVDLKDTIYKVFIRNGYLDISDVCRNNLRHVIRPQNHLSLYPNPVDDFLTLEFDYLPDLYLNVDVFNSVGSCVYSSRISKKRNKKTVRINLRHLPAGIYFISFTSDSINEIRPFVKE